MNNHIRNLCKGAHALSLALGVAAPMAASAAEPSPPPNKTPQTAAGDNAARQGARAGDGVAMKAEAMPPLVAVKAADGTIVVQHSAEISAPQKKAEVR
jgi:hypothetical protein